MKQAEQFLKGVGEKIKNKRLESKFTQRDVEDLVGISLKHYQKYEAGCTTQNLKVLFRLAKVFRCKVSDFFEGE